MSHSSIKSLSSNVYALFGLCLVVIDDYINIKVIKCITHFMQMLGEKRVKNSRNDIISNNQLIT